MTDFFFVGFRSTLSRIFRFGLGTPADSSTKCQVRQVLHEHHQLSLLIHWQSVEIQPKHFAEGADKSSCDAVCKRMGSVVQFIHNIIFLFSLRGVKQFF